MWLIVCRESCRQFLDHERSHSRPYSPDAFKRGNKQVGGSCEEFGYEATYRLATELPQSLRVAQGGPGISYELDLRFGRMGGGSRHRISCTVRPRGVVLLMFGKMLFRRKASQAMKGNESPSLEELERVRQRWQGKPLRSRAVWAMGPATYVLACVAGLIVVLNFAEGIWLGIGLTVVAFFAGHIPELFIEFRYSKYRTEWELANGPRP